MKTSKRIAENLLQVFEGDNWTDVWISETIKDINYKEAQQPTAASANTIAALLHHICYWNKIMLQRLYGNDPSVPDVNGFDVKPNLNEAEWNQLKEQTHQAFIELADAIKNFPEEKLDESYSATGSSYYKNFQGTVEHAHYHLGQIVMLKQLVRKAD
jgi:uncharacterized damage-inducible protein DinB